MYNLVLGAPRTYFPKEVVVNERFIYLINTKN